MNPIELWNEIDKTIREHSKVLWSDKAKIGAYDRVYRGGKYIVAVGTLEEAEALQDAITSVCNRDEFLRHLIKNKKEVLDPYHPRMRTIVLSKGDLTLRLSLKPVRQQVVQTPRQIIDENEGRIESRISDIERDRTERFEARQKDERALYYAVNAGNEKMAQKYESVTEHNRELDKKIFQDEEVKIKELWQNHEKLRQHLEKYLELDTEYIFSWYGRSSYYRVTYYSPKDDKRRQVSVGDLLIAVVGKDNLSAAEVVEVKSKRKPRKDRIDGESLLPETVGSGYSVRPYNPKNA